MRFEPREAQMVLAPILKSALLRHKPLHGSFVIFSLFSSTLSILSAAFFSVAISGEAPQVPFNAGTGLLDYVNNLENRTLFVLYASVCLAAAAGFSYLSNRVLITSQLRAERDEVLHQIKNGPRLGSYSKKDRIYIVATRPRLLGRSLAGALSILPNVLTAMLLIGILFAVGGFMIAMPMTLAFLLLAFLISPWRRVSVNVANLQSASRAFSVATGDLVVDSADATAAVVKAHSNVCKAYEDRLRFKVTLSAAWGGIGALALAGVFLVSHATLSDGNLLAMFLLVGLLANSIRGIVLASVTVVLFQNALMQR
jgi:hypothetical protein